MKILNVITIAIFFCNCTEVKQVANFKEISSKHKLIALLPSNAQFKLNTNQKSAILKEQLEESELKLSFMIQTELNKWFEKNKKSYSISVQNIKTTNELLFAKGMSFATYKSIDKDSLG
jgi:hypothetical protein